MKNKMVKMLLIAGCMTVCVTAIMGIHKAWYREPQQKASAENQMEAEPEMMVKVEPEQAVLAEEDLEIFFPADSPEEKGNEQMLGTEPAGMTEPVEEESLVIQPEPVTDVESGVQELQPAPEKTEEERPQEPPALKENADITKPNTPPAYEEPKESAPVKDTPTHGTTKDGLIYIDGFGWIPNKGGGGSGSTAEDMYENGNKVGAMG
ncbi:MAG: hypothetical protein IKK03_09775 [Lachnospiraceae bacterium]|nr:hypothetical protein [Lachnospiraceae bacterium]